VEEAPLEKYLKNKSGAQMLDLKLKIRMEITTQNPILYM
jgi:hypothetical protein